MSIELIKLKQIEPLDKAVTDIVGDGTVPLAFCLQAVLLQSNWVVNGSTYEYSYTNAAINEHSIAQVIPNNDDMNISRAAILLPANSSYNGGLRIYAMNAPGGDIRVSINIFGDGVEPSEPVLPSRSRDIDGGSAWTVYLQSQQIDGGNANSIYLPSQQINGGNANG